MELLLSATLALGGTPDSESSCFLFLRYLARHQMPDGSWGGRAAGCDCPDPAPPPAAPADPRVTAALIRALGDDDPGTRDSAERDLRALDRSALAALQAAASGDSEVRLRCERVRADITARSRGEGDAETTGLALLSFMGAGYTHLSRDSYDDACFGDAIRRALRWLADRQYAEGRFDAKDGVANAIAALAMCEAWGLTGSNLWKDAAGRGVAAVFRTDPKDSREQAWKALVVASAQISGFEGPFDEQTDQAVRALRESAPLSTRAAVAFLSRIVKKQTDEAAVIAISEAQPAELDAETRYLATGALHLMEGRQGLRWKAWSPAIKDALVPSQIARTGRCERGSWEAADSRTRLRTAALGGLALETYYGYGGVLGAAK